MATATGASTDALWSVVPYRRTLYEFFHLQQIDYQRELRERANAIYMGALMSFAFNDPKQIQREQQKLLDECKLSPSPEESRLETESLLSEMASRGWLTVQ